MNKADFTDLLKNPEKLGTEHIETLRKIVADFPFFSTAHVLLAKALANTNHYEYEKQLKITALLTGDRSVLYQFITGNKDQEGDTEGFNVPLELKVEKVSKPDFEITEQEAQEAALLNEANSILEEAETNDSNKITETETVEPETNNVEATIIVESEEEEKTDDTYPYEFRGGKVENTDETATNESIEEVASELPQEEVKGLIVEEENIALEEEITDNIQEQQKEVLADGVEETIQGSVETLAEEDGSSLEDEPKKEEQDDIVEPVESVEQTTEPVAEDNNDNSSENTQLTESMVAVNSKEKVYQLAETEGTLVRFRGNFSEEILQDFDETSLEEDNKENIETVTKFVIPVVPKEEQASVLPDSTEEENENYLAEANVEEQLENPALDIPLMEEAAIEEDVDTIEPVDETENHEEEKVVGETQEPAQVTEQPVFAVEPVIPVSLDELLEKYNDEDEGIEEPVVENEPGEIEVQETPLEEAELETTEAPIAEYSTATEGGLNFIDWLIKNKTETTQNNESKAEIKTNTNAEDDELTLYIQHLIKAKAESTLAKNIEAETAFEKTEEEIPAAPAEEPVTENIVSAIELPDVDPRLIEEEEEVEQVKDIIPVIEPFMVEPSVTAISIDTTEGEEDSTFEEIEAFKVNTKAEEAKDEKEPVVAETVTPPFIDEVLYSGQVESILPDFEKLNVQSNEQGKQENFFTFDESEDFVPAENEINSVADDEPEINETVRFEPVVFNEDMFNSSFMQTFPGGKHLTELNQQQQEPAIKTPPSKMEVESILEKFMRENPSITRPKAEFFNPVNVAKLSVEEKDEIVSETLASIYLKQGLVKKAISTYEKLSLIYPHKIAYFAALIKQLKTEHNIN